MNNKEFISELARRMNFSQAETQKKVYHVVDAMNGFFQEGDAVSVTGFGIFEVKKKMERVVVNPVSGQRMLVPPKLVLGFKPSTLWKEKLKKGGEE
jgi:DNA-binding protein HU-beta/integration host factor subunit alpha